MDDLSGSAHTDLVVQAQRMVSIQAGCSISEALMLMTARAHTLHRTLEEVAAGVVLRDIRFD